MATLAEVQMRALLHDSAIRDRKIHTLNHGMVIRLADEGVPVAAIARAFEVHRNHVSAILRDAVKRGYLATLPAGDWPPGSRCKRDPATMPMQLGPDFEHVVTWLCLRYRLAPQEAKLLYALISTRELTKASLHIAISDTDTPLTTHRTVDVIKFRLKRKMKAFGVDVRAIWGRGYFIDHETRARIRADIASGKLP